MTYVAYQFFYTQLYVKERLKLTARIIKCRNLKLGNCRLRNIKSTEEILLRFQIKQNKMM